MRHQAKSARGLLRSGCKHHIFMHDTKAIIINRPGSVTTSRRKLKQQVFLFVPLLPISSRFRMCLFCHSTLVRLRRGRSRRHSSSSSSRSLQLQPHHQYVDCRHGLLVALLVLCDTCSVCCCYTCTTRAIVVMYLLHISTAVVVTIELSNSGVCALRTLIRLVSCGAVALPPPERGYLHLGG